MKKMIITLIALVGLTGLAFGADIGSLIKKAQLQSLPAGTKIVDFTLSDLAGKKVKLSDFNGKVVLLNFWATWCPPCRSEIPELEALYKLYKDKGFVILGVDLQEGQSAVKDFVSKYNMSFPVLLDSTGRVGAEYGARSIPTTYLIDKDGNVTSGTLGARSWVTPEIKSLIEAMLQ